MKLLDKDKHLNMLKLMPESLDDLWHLEKIIEPEDIVKGLTSRKIKAEEGRDSFRQIFYIELKVQNIVYDDFTGILRVNGLVLDAKPLEFIELNSFQGIEIKLFEQLVIIKNKWREHHVKMLKKIIQTGALKPYVILLIDDEQADIAILKEFQFELKITIRGMKQGGKIFLQEEKKDKHFQEILIKLRELKTERLILAGPGFVKDDLNEFLKKNNFEGQIFLTHANHVGITGLNDLLADKESQKIFKELEVIQQQTHFDEFLKNLGKNNGLALYGSEQIKQAIQLSAVRTILLTDKFFAKEKEKADFLMTEAENRNAIIKIIPSRSELGEKIDSFNGLIAILRFRPF